jgi:hypothetical protein
MRALILCAALALGACIAPSVVDPADRAVDLNSAELVWQAAMPSDVPGTYVSTELSGPLAAALRMLVYLFEADGHYTGAALFDDAPPHFEVLTGMWELTAAGLVLDGGPPGRIEVAPDGSLRLSSDEGRVVLRREASH